MDITSADVIKREATLAGFVAARVQKIQGSYLAGNSRSKAELAELRKNVGKELGTDPAVWQIVFSEFPDRLTGHTDSPNRWESAAYTAFTLFAMHMQSAKKSMHIPRVGLGTAIQQLLPVQDAEEQNLPILRRFHALGTAESFSEITYHMRGIIQLLRRKEIGLDYGKLASNLADLQVPEKQNKVRLEWARELYKRTN